MMKAIGITIKKRPVLLTRTDFAQALGCGVCP